MSTTQSINRDDLRETIALLEKDVRIYTAWARALSRDNAGGQRNGDIQFLRDLTSEHDHLVIRLKAALESDEDDPPASETPVPVQPQPDQPAGEVRKEVAA